MSHDTAAFLVLWAFYGLASIIGAVPVIMLAVVVADAWEQARRRNRRVSWWLW